MLEKALTFVKANKASFIKNGAIAIGAIAAVSILYVIQVAAESSKNGTVEVVDENGEPAE